MLDPPRASTVQVSCFTAESQTGREAGSPRSWAISGQWTRATGLLANRVLGNSMVLPGAILLGTI